MTLSGERYYRKRRGLDEGSSDPLRLVPPCRHDKWQGTHRAEKAKKGVARLEGRNDWKSMHRCAVCGVWRVRW